MYIASGDYHTVLISDDGQHVWTFGINEHGQLGLGMGVNKGRNVPTEIPRGENGLSKDVRIIGVSCGSSHTVLLSDDGRIWVFGDNTCGQLGLGMGDNEYKNVPTEIQREVCGFPEDVKIVNASCGVYHTVLIYEDGRIWTYAFDFSDTNDILNQIDLGDDIKIDVPTEIHRNKIGFPEDVRIIGSSCGDNYTALLSDDGRIWTFGENYYGQLGLGMGDNEYKNVPTEIQRNINGLLEDVRIISVSCGHDHTVLLSDDGRIWTFGLNDYGQLGLGDRKYRNVPTEIQRGLNGLLEDVKIIGVSCGAYHTVLLSEDGKHIWTFGKNTYGQLGLGMEDNEDKNIPTEIQRNINGLLEDVRIIGASCGYDHTVLLSDDGRIWTFGNDTYGQLGLGMGDREKIIIPTEIQDFSLRQFGSLTKSANKT